MISSLAHLEARADFSLAVDEVRQIQTLNRPNLIYPGEGISYCFGL